MMSKGLLCFLSVLVAGATAAPHEKRTTHTDTTVYAYGEGLLGLPVYSDSNGLAVIAVNGSDTSELSSVTWSIDTTGSSAWNVSLNATDIASFYIVPSSDAYTPAGFIVNETIPAGAETLGFVLYGNDIEYRSGDTYLYQFWAQNTSAGLWNVMWNGNGDLQDGSVPIMLKPTAPTSA